MHSANPLSKFEFRTLLLSLKRDRQLCSEADNCCPVNLSSKTKCTENMKRKCILAYAEPQLNSIQQWRVTEKVKLASVTVATVGGVSYKGDLPDS